MRKRFEWKLRTRTLQLGDRTLLMGILNVTPDSFTDGGKYADPDRAFARAIEMEEEGVDIIDIGAESTRPDSQRISEAEELRRLVPVLKRLQGKLNVPISVDTYKSAVALRALEYGAEIINDPSGLTFDVELARVASNGDAGLILNHMRGTPDMWAKLPPLKDVGATVLAELDAAIHRARRGGVDPKRIVIDPGIGFGKRREQNSELIARLGELNQLNRPLLIGVSRKQFLAKENEASTEFATAAAVAASVLNGAHIVRVHDVKSMSAVVQVADTILAAAPEPKVEEEKRSEKRRPPFARADKPLDEHKFTDARPPRESLPVRESQPPGDAPPRRSLPPPAEETRVAPVFRPDRDAPRRDDRPPFRGGPPRRDSPPRQDGPPSRSGPPQRRDGPPFRSGPPRRDSPARKDGPPNRTGPPRRGAPPRGDGPPPRRNGPPPRKGPPRPPGKRPPGRPPRRSS